MNGHPDRKLSAVLVAVAGLAIFVAVALIWSGITHVAPMPGPNAGRLQSTSPIPSILFASAVPFLFVAILSGLGALIARSPEPTSRARDLANRIPPALIVFALAHWFAGFGVLLVLGGLARTGKVEAGVYYLGSHGTFTPVSESVFHFMWFYEYYVLPNYVLMLCAVAGLAVVQRGVGIRAR